MTSWLRALGDDLRLVPAKDAKVSVSYPDRDYVLFPVGISDEQILLEWWLSDEPEEIVRTGGGVLVGPKPNGRIA